MTEVERILIDSYDKTFQLGDFKFSALLFRHTIFSSSLFVSIT